MTTMVSMPASIMASRPVSRDGASDASPMPNPAKDTARGSDAQSGGSGSLFSLGNLASDGSFDNLLNEDLADAQRSLESFVKTHTASLDPSGQVQDNLPADFDIDKLPPDLLAMVKDLVETEAPAEASYEELTEVAEQSGPEILAIVQQFISAKKAAVAKGSEFMHIQHQRNLTQPQAVNPDAGRRSLQANHQSLNQDGKAADQQAKPAVSFNQQPLTDKPVEIKSTPIAGTALPKGAEPTPAASPRPGADAAALYDLVNQTRAGNATELPAITVPRDARFEQANHLASLLGNRLSYQADNGIQKATVRLDPPELGKLDLSVRKDGNDRLNIVINTHNPQTRDLVLQNIDRLRMELMNGDHGEVNVEVGYQSDNQDNESQQGEGKASNVIANLAGEAEERMDDQTKQHGVKHWLSISA